MSLLPHERILLKACNGGGGIGIRKVNCPDQLQKEIMIAKQEAFYSFKDKNIYYVPDYLANSGGVIIVEKSKDKTLVDLSYESPTVKNRLDSIYNTVFTVLYQSVKTNQTTIKICNDLAETRFQ